MGYTRQNRKNFVKTFLSKIFPAKVETESGEIDSNVYIKHFNKQQLPGAVIRTGKKTGYRVISNATLNGMHQRTNGDQELVKVAFR